MDSPLDANGVTSERQAEIEATTAHIAPSRADPRRIEVVVPCA
jgi:hypothetical protein